MRVRTVLPVPLQTSWAKGAAPETIRGLAIPEGDLNDFEVRVGSWYRQSYFDTERLSSKKLRYAHRISPGDSIYQGHLGDS